MQTMRRGQAALLAVALLLPALPARAADIDPFLPDDTEVVVTVNIKQILGSSLLKKIGLEKLKDALKEDADVEKTLTDLGFDPLNDVERITMAGPGEDGPDKGLIIVQGRFDLAKFHAKGEEAAKEHGDIVKIQKVKEGIIYEVNIPGQPQTMFVALPNKTTLVASGGKDYVVESLKRGGGQKGALKSKELKALLEKADAKQSLWLTAMGSALAKGQLGQLEGTKDSVGKITHASGGVTLDEEIKVEFGLVTKDAAAAKDLAKAIDEGLAQAKVLASLVAAGQKELAPLLEILSTVKSTAKDTVVTIKGKVSSDLIDGALKKDK